MTDRQIRRLSMFVRVRGFVAQRLSDFSETGIARQLYIQLQAVITRIESLSAAQASGIGEARQRTESRGDARDVLDDAIDAIHAVAESMGLGHRFPAPPRTDAGLLQCARSAVADAVEFKAQFIAHEMPPDFIENLQAAITAFEAEIAGHGDAVGDHVEAGIGLELAFDEGLEIVQKLDGIIRAKYASNRAVVGEWTSASHTERDPKRSTAPSPSTGAPPAGSSTP